MQIVGSDRDHVRITPEQGSRRRAYSRAGRELQPRSRRLTVVAPCFLGRSSPFSHAPFEIQGQITHINFAEGQLVHAGDLLAQIDPRPRQAQLDQYLRCRCRTPSLTP